MHAASDLSLAAFQDALERGDRLACEALTQALLAQGYPIIDLYESYFKPALYHIGSLWESNRISVAREHLATAIVEGLMNDIFSRLMTLERTGHTAVVAPVEGELHHVGARMVCDVFEMHGWDAILVSSNTQIETLLGTLQTRRPELVGLSCSLHFHLPNLHRTIMAVHEAFPLLPILIGGQALARIDAATISDLPGVILCQDLIALHGFLFDRDGRQSG